MKRVKHKRVFKDGFNWRVAGPLGAGYGTTLWSSWEKAFVYAQYEKVMTQENAVLFLKRAI